MRETRLSGSVRGGTEQSVSLPRHPSTRCRRQRAFHSPPIPHSNPPTGRTESPQRHPLRGRITTLPGEDLGADRRLDPEQHKATPHPGAAREPNPQLKKKLSGRPLKPRVLTLTRSRIARPGSLRTPTVGTLLDGQDRRYCFFRALGFISTAGSQIIRVSALTSASVGRCSSTDSFSSLSQLHSESHFVGSKSL